MEERREYGSFLLQWHITHRCNLRCTHCYQEDYSAFGTREELLRVLEQFGELIREYKAHGHINITGGEPMIHPDLFFLLDEIKRRGMTFGILTNGTVIDTRIAKRLSLFEPEFVQVSLDGTRKVHDAIRGEGSYDAAMYGLYALRSRGIRTMVSFTAQRENLGELKKLARICDYNGIDKLWFDRVIIPEEEDEKKLTLSSDQYDRLLRTAARLNRRGTVYCDRALQFIYAKEKRIYRCMAGDRLVIVLADGSVMPCRRIPLTAGNIADSSLLEIYRDSPVFRDLREAALPEECRDCEYAESCHGGAKCLTYAKTGRWDIADPDCPLLRKK